MALEKYICFENHWYLHLYSLLACLLSVLLYPCLTLFGVSLGVVLGLVLGLALENPLGASIGSLLGSSFDMALVTLIGMGLLLDNYLGRRSLGALLGTWTGLSFGTHLGAPLE